MLAEQRRREAVKETSIDLLALENLRAMARMSEDEVNQSKAIITCFLAGERDGKVDARKDVKGSKAMDDFQTNVINESCGVYHYFHDSSEPLPQHPREMTMPQSTQQNIEFKKPTVQGDNCSIYFSPNATGAGVGEGYGDRDPAADSRDLTTSVPQLKRKWNDIPTENDSFSAVNRSTHNAKPLGNNKKESESSNQTPKTLARDDFIKYDKNRWVCEKCVSVHPSFRAEDATFTKKPREDMKQRHRALCLGEKADLSVLVNSFHALTKSSKVRFHHLSTKEFKAVISSVVGGNEDFVTLFTDDVRKLWMNPKHMANSTTRVKWSEFPFSNIQEEEVQVALARFARIGVGFDFVENPHFENFFRLIAPNFSNLNQDCLVKCW